MAKTAVTSSRVATSASKVLLSKKEDAKAKSAPGSALAQSPGLKVVAKVAPKKAAPAKKVLHKKSAASKKHSK
jgi:hypothetical protein